jgi:23S rRNA (adenine2503-C2)-methyltransferase
MSAQRINIRNLNLEELRAHIVGLGEPAFRAKQVYEWIWKKQVHAFEEMANIGKSL